MSAINGSCALITGASAGIGREFARQLAGRAATLVLVARRLERLEALREELQAQHSQLRVETRHVDLTQAEEIANLLRWLEEKKLAIDLLINNAGLGDLGAFATADPEKLDRILLVNVVALTRLTRALLPAMIARRRGAILNVSSSAGFLPMPNFTVYAATKAYVTSFSEGLRNELRGSGIGLTTLCPGPVETEFTEVAHRHAQENGKFGPGFVYVSVQEVVAAALRGLDRNRAIVIPGWAMKASMAIVRLMPLPALRFASRFSGKPPE